MKKLFSLMILGLLVLSMGTASAKVVITGVTYNFVDPNNIFPEGDVNVIASCTHNGEITTKNTTSNSIDGVYVVSFSQSPKECDVGYTVTVSGSKGGLSGSASGIVHDGELFGIDIDLGVINVPLVPEFGIFVGVLTLFGAVGVFFLIRRE